MAKDEAKKKSKAASDDEKSKASPKIEQVDSGRPEEPETVAPVRIGPKIGTEERKKAAASARRAKRRPEGPKEPSKAQKKNNAGSGSDGTNPPATAIEGLQKIDIEIVTPSDQTIVAGKDSETSAFDRLDSATAEENSLASLITKPKAKIAKLLRRKIDSPEDGEEPSLDTDPTTAGPGTVETGKKNLRHPLWVALCGLLLGLFAGLYFTLGSLLITHTNRDDDSIRSADQKHNIKLAVMTRQIRSGTGPHADASQAPKFVRGLPNYTDGVVSPLWPWMASFLVPEGTKVNMTASVTASERTTFGRGRWFLLLTSGLFLVGLGAMLLRYFSIPAVFAALLLGGMGALLPRSAYFQPETLSYILTTIAFIMAMLIFRTNGLLGYVGFGIAIAGAYLAKASIQPIVIAFLAATTWRAVSAWRHQRLDGGESQNWSQVGHFLGLGIVFIMFVLIAGPRMLHSSNQFGSGLHTYPSKWMWLDNFEEGYSWMQAHGSSETIDKAIESGEAPSATNYLANHTIGAAWSRITDGTAYVVRQFLSPKETRRGVEERSWKNVLEYRGWLLGVLLALAIGLAISLKIAGRPIRGSIVSNHGTSGALFVILSVALSAVAYGWYLPIGKGDRFMLTLYLPLVLSLIWLCERYYRLLPKNPTGDRIGWCYLGALTLLIVFLSYRALEVIRLPSFT